MDDRGPTDETRMWSEQERRNAQTRNVLLTVYHAMEEKGYNPINQLVGYLLSGDPAYITNYANARTLIRTIERDDILEELLRSYLIAHK